VLPEDAIVVPPPLDRWRRFALDGALLLFDRATGLSALCDGDETAGLRMRAPRVVQFAITNACNLACTFCSRDTEATSDWTPDTAFELLRDLDAAGTLEVAFGGGEPLVFRGFVDLVARLGRETRLAVSLTTNGTRLTPEVARALAPHVGQIRISLYDDVDVLPAISALAASGASWGVNYLVTPARLPDVETTVLDLATRGCRDVLLLSYNGLDPALHLSPPEARELTARVARLCRGLGRRMALKLDVCWGNRMEAVPTLFGLTPCAAGREFVVVTSDRRLAPCSFHHVSIPFDSPRELLARWQHDRVILATPARDPGCARTPGFGRERLHTSLPLHRS
jgi:MoaA/NifB/PqqE/SkfB family radical SAM enzyme